MSKDVAFKKALVALFREHNVTEVENMCWFDPDVRKEYEEDLAKWEAKAEEWEEDNPEPEWSTPAWNKWAKEQEIACGEQPEEPFYHDSYNAPDKLGFWYSSNC